MVGAAGSGLKLFLFEQEGPRVAALALRTAMPALVVVHLVVACTLVRQELCERRQRFLVAAPTIFKESSWPSV